MSFNNEASIDREHQIPDRYLKIEAANKHSFYVNNPHRTFDAFQSVHSIGERRIDLVGLSEAELNSVSAAKRFIAGGNMSPLSGYGPSELSAEKRPEDARKNMKAFLNRLPYPRHPSIC